MDNVDYIPTNVNSSHQEGLLYLFEDNEAVCADSMECYTYRRNIQGLLFDGKTPYERHCGKPFKGPIIPVGSLVEYHPIFAKDQ